VRIQSRPFQKDLNRLILEPFTFVSKQRIENSKKLKTHFMDNLQVKRKRSRIPSLREGFGLEILKEDELLDLTESEASRITSSEGTTATFSGLSEISDDDLQTKKSKMFKILSLLCVGNADFAD